MCTVSGTVLLRDCAVSRSLNDAYDMDLRTDVTWRGWLTVGCTNCLVSVRARLCPDTSEGMTFQHHVPSLRCAVSNLTVCQRSCCGASACNAQATWYYHEGSIGTGRSIIAGSPTLRRKSAVLLYRRARRLLAARAARLDGASQHAPPAAYLASSTKR
jgi:hypothetical protein